MARTIAKRRTAKKGGGFWRGVFLLLLGFTFGAGAAAYLAAYINELPLPLITPPTRDAELPAADSLQRTRRETLEFYETLRQQREAPVAAEEESDVPVVRQESAARKFVYYLQLGAFADRELAESLRGELAFAGERAQIRPGGEDGEVFRVWAGPYPDEAAAEESRAKLSLAGYNNAQLLKLAERSDDENDAE